MAGGISGGISWSEAVTLVLWEGFGHKIFCPKVLLYFVLEGIPVHMQRL